MPRTDGSPGVEREQQCGDSWRTVMDTIIPQEEGYLGRIRWGRREICQRRLVRVRYSHRIEFIPVSTGNGHRGAATLERKSVWLPTLRRLLGESKASRINHPKMKHNSQARTGSGTLPKRY